MNRGRWKLHRSKSRKTVSSTFSRAKSCSNALVSCFTTSLAVNIIALTCHSSLALGVGDGDVSSSSIADDEGDGDGDENGSSPGALVSKITLPSAISNVLR